MGKYIIYKATSPSGKSYIGLTKRGLTKRKWEHINYAKNMEHKTIFYCALRKYNYEMQWEILVENLDLNKAEELEIKYIQDFKTLDRAFGYNINTGGNAGTKMSEEGKIRRKEKMQKHYNNPEYIKKMSESKKNSITEESKKHLSEKVKEYFKDPNNLKKHSELSKKSAQNPETRRKRAVAKGGKPFKCNETGEIFYTLYDAQLKLGTDRRCVHDVLKGKAKTSKGYTFNYLIEGE